MRNTTKYYQAVKSFRKDMRDLEAKYQTELEKLEPHKGSDYYKQQKQALDKCREMTLGELRKQHGKVFEDIFAAMEHEYAGKPMKAPTADQLATLQLLKMRDTGVTREELRQAANACKGCPAALSVLKEIAHKSGIPAGIVDNGDTMPISENLRTLRRRTSYLLGAERVDQRKEIMDNIKVSDNWEKWHIDADPTDEADALRMMGLIPDAKAFGEAVNASEE